MSNNARYPLLLKLMAFFVLAAMPLSFSVSLLAPQKTELTEGTAIDVGTIGPGQTVAIVVDPKVATGGKFGIGGVYDQVVISNMPEGWTTKPSTLTSNPLQAEFSVSPQAQEGDYLLSAQIIDEGNAEGLGTVNVKIKVHVTQDVLGVTVDPQDQTVSAGQPARYTITITNKAYTNDVYEISSSGVKAWEFKRDVFVPAQSSKQVIYEVVGLDQSAYTLNINVKSKSSDLIQQSQVVYFSVHSNLLSDMKATNNGVMIFPIFLQPLYSLAGLISNLY